MVFALASDYLVGVFRPGRDRYAAADVGAACLYAADQSLIATLEPPEDHAFQFANFGRPIPQRDRGLAEVYRLQDGALVAAFNSPNPEFYNDRFGSDIALIGEQVLVGAQWDNVSGIEDGGAAYLFDLPQSFVAGDFDRDGDVDSADYGEWRGNFGSATHPLPDANLNGAVDAADYVIWRNRLVGGLSSSAPLNAPELLTLWMVVIGLMAAWLGRRRLAWQQHELPAFARPCASGIQGLTWRARKTSLAIYFMFAILAVAPSEPAQAGFFKLWQAGEIDFSVDDMGVESRTSNPPPGSATIRDDDYYFAGTYPAPIGVTSHEPLSNFERSLTSQDETNRIHFVLRSDASAEFQFKLEFGSQYAQGGSGSQEWLVSFNGSAIFHDRVTAACATALLDCTAAAASTRLRTPSVSSEHAAQTSSICWLFPSTNEFLQAAKRFQRR